MSPTGYVLTEQVSMTRVPGASRSPRRVSTSSMEEMATQRKTAGSAAISPSVTRVTPGGTARAGSRENARTSHERERRPAQNEPNLPRP